MNDAPPPRADVLHGHSAADRYNVGFRFSRDVNPVNRGCRGSFERRGGPTMTDVVAAVGTAFARVAGDGRVKAALDMRAHDYPVVGTARRSGRSDRP